MSSSRIWAIRSSLLICGMLACVSAVSTATINQTPFNQPVNQLYVNGNGGLDTGTVSCEVKVSWGSWNGTTKKFTPKAPTPAGGYVATTNKFGLAYDFTTTGKFYPAAGGTLYHVESILYQVIGMNPSKAAVENIASITTP